MLSKINAHPRDSNISFDDKGHIYTIKLVDKHPISVTTLIHNYFKKFDSDEVIDKMMASPKWPKSVYFGMTKDEIKNKWKLEGETSTTLGTQLHANIEKYLNNEIKEDDITTYDFKLFITFWKKFTEINNTFKVYRTEWYIYDEDAGIAGSIDCVIINDKNEFIILDWKRSKEIKRENKFSKGFGPVMHLDDCNFNTYSLQLNLYRHVLETKYDKKIVGMFLAVFHPNLEECDFICVNINDTDIINIINHHCGQK